MLGLSLSSRVSNAPGSRGSAARKAGSGICQQPGGVAGIAVELGVEVAVRRLESADGTAVLDVIAGNAGLFLRSEQPLPASGRAAIDQPVE